MHNKIPLVTHHVGGRTGSRSFPYVPRFEADIVNVLYDADPDCLDQVRQLNADLKSSLIVLPYCLGSSHGAATLYMAHDPYMSSLYEINPAYADYYTMNIDMDYIHGEVGKPAKELQIEMVTLDELLWQDKRPAPLPDFLSIDVQGAEYDILMGAARTLDQSVLGLILEVSFHEIYKDQKLFGDLTRMLHERGFLFVDFTERIPATPNREPVGLRAEEFLIGADALYLRDCDAIDTSDPARAVVMLRKLAYIAIAFERIEYAFKCLRKSRALAQIEKLELPADAGYMSFVKELEAAANRMPAIYPQTFAQRYPTFEDSNARFTASEQAASKKGLYGRLKDAFGRRYPNELITMWQTKQAAADYLTTLPMRISPSPVETVLKKYGMRKLARKVLKRRLAETRLCRPK